MASGSTATTIVMMLLLASSACSDEGAASSDDASTSGGGPSAGGASDAGGGGATGSGGTAGEATAGAGGGTGGDGGDEPGDLCAAFPNVLSVDLPWGNGQNVTTGALGGFPAEAILVGRIDVPADAVPGPLPGNITLSEYQGPPTNRTVSLSLYPCDLRGIEAGFPFEADLTGARHPLAWSYGQSATTLFLIGPADADTPGLLPGQTYYFNALHYSPDTMANTCLPLEACDAIVTVSPPNN
jgi:hypothetical protein